MSLGGRAVRYLGSNGVGSTHVCDFRAADPQGTLSDPRVRFHAPLAQRYDKPRRVHV